MIQTITRALTGRRGTGFIEGPYAAHVKPLSGLIGASSVLPPAHTVRSSLVSPKDQSSTDSCLGQSAAQATRTSILAKGVPCPDLSALFPYKLGRASLGIGNVDGGMTFGALTTAVERFGICTEEAWAFSVLKVNLTPSAAAFHDAYDRKGVRGYYSIDATDLDGVRRAIAHNYAGVGAFPVDGYFGINSGDTLIDAPQGGVIGNHAMVIEDYQADGTFGLLNHYGVQWRMNGRCRFTSAYMKRSLGFLVFDLD